MQLELEKDGDLTDLSAGSIASVKDQTYVLAESPVSQGEGAVDRIDSELRTSEALKILTLMGEPFTSPVNLPILTLKRIQQTELLKRMGNQLAVRFHGDYSTKYFDLSRFEAHSNRFLLENQANQLKGIYHLDERSLLFPPSGDGKKGPNVASNKVELARYAVANLDKCSQTTVLTASESGQSRLSSR